MQEHNKTIEKLINFDDVTKGHIKEYYQGWLQLLDHPCRILIIPGSGSGKMNSLLNLICKQPDIGKTHSYAKDSFELKYQFLINKRKSTGLKHFNDSKASIEQSNNMDDIYENTEEHNPNKTH